MGGEFGECVCVRLIGLSCGWGCGEDDDKRRTAARRGEEGCVWEEEMGCVESRSYKGGNQEKGTWTIESGVETLE